jgi:hypothetical protein
VNIHLLTVKLKHFIWYRFARNLKSDENGEVPLHDIINEYNAFAKRKTGSSDSCITAHRLGKLMQSLFPNSVAIRQRKFDENLVSRKVVVYKGVTLRNSESIQSQIITSSNIENFLPPGIHLLQKKCKHCTAIHFD